MDDDRVELQEFLLGDSHTDDVSSDDMQWPQQYNPRPTHSSRRNNIIAAVAAVCVLGVVFSVLAGTGVIGNNTDHTQSPQRVEESQEATAAYQQIQKSCTSGKCSFDDVASQLGCTGSCQTPYKTDLGSFELSGGTFALKSGIHRRSTDSNSGPKYIEYNGAMKVRNVPLDGTVYMAYSGEQLELFFSAGSNKDLRPSWVKDGKDPHIMPQVAGISCTEKLPSAILSKTKFLYSTFSLSSVKSGAYPIPSGTKPGLHIDGSVDASGVSFLAAFGSKEIEYSISGELRPTLSLELTASLDGFLQFGKVKMSGIHAKLDVSANCDETPWHVSLNSLVLLPGAKTPLELGMTATMTNGVMAFKADVDNWVLKKECNGDTCKDLVVNGTFAMTVTTPSDTWTCQPDYEVCPIGWVNVNRTSCINAAETSCEDLSAKLGVDAPYLAEEVWTSRPCPPTCDCECLKKQPQNNATLDQWRDLSCNPSPCSALDFHTKDARTAFLADCSYVQFPCKPEITVSIDGSLNIFSVATAKLSIDLSTSDDVLSIDLHNVPLDSANHIVLQNAVLNMSKSEVAVGGIMGINTHLADKIEFVADITVDSDNALLFSGSAIHPVDVDAGVSFYDFKAHVRVPFADPSATLVGASVLKWKNITGSANGKITFGTNDFTANAYFNGWEGLYVIKFDYGSYKTKSFANALDVVCQNECPINTMSLPTAAQAQLASSNVVEIQGSIIIAPTPSIFLEGSVDFQGKGTETGFEFFGTRTQGDFHFVVALTLEKSFTFSSVTGQTGLDLPVDFVDGAIFASTFPADNPSFPTRLYNGYVSNPVTPGGEVVAKVPSTVLSDIHFGSSWASGDLSAVASYQTGTKDYDLEITLPRNGKLNDWLTINQGSLSVTNGPKFDVSASMTIQTHMKSAQQPLTLQVAGEVADGDYTLSGTLNNWVLDSDVTITNVKVTLDGGKSKSFTGTLDGDMSLFGTEVDVQLVLPAKAGDVEALEVPTLKLANWLSLNDIVVQDKTDVSFSASANAVVTVPDHTPITFESSYVSTKETDTVTGTLETLQITDSVTLSNLKFDYVKQKSSGKTTATISGDVSTPMGDVDFNVDLPFTATEGFTITITNGKLGNDVTVPTASMTITTDKVTYSADVDVKLGTTLQFTGNGEIMKDGELTFNGELKDQWKFDNRALITDVTLNLDSKTVDGKKSTTGVVDGNVNFAGVDLNVHVTIPPVDTEITFDVPSIKLSNEVMLKNIVLVFSDDKSVDEFTFTGECIISVDQEQPLTTAASGMVKSGVFEVNATATNWVIEIGSGFTIQDIFVHVSKVKGVVSGSLSAITTISSTEFDVRMAIPGPSGKGAEFELSLKKDAGPSHFQCAQVLSHVGLSDSANYAPASELKTVPVDNLEIIITTSPVVFNMTGTATVFGTDEVGVVLSVQKHEDKWGYYIRAALASIKSSDVVPSSSWFDKFPFARAEVVVTDMPIQYSLASETADCGAQSSGVNAGELFVIEGTVEFSSVTSQMQTVSLWKDVPDAVNAWLLVDISSATVSDKDISFHLTMPQDLKLDSEVTIDSGCMTAQSIEPHFVVNAQATVTVPGVEANLVLQTKIVDGPDAWTFEGSLSNLHIGVGKVGIEVSDLTGSFSVTKGTHAFSGKLTGEVILTAGKFDFLLEYPIPSTNHGAEIMLSFGNENAHQTVTMNGMASSIQAPVVINDFAKMSDKGLYESAILIKTSPLSFSLTGNAHEAFGVDTSFAVDLTILHTGGDGWHWGFGFELAEGMKISEITSAWGVLDKLPTVLEGGIVVSSTAMTVPFPGGAPVAAIDGVKMWFNLPSTGKLAVIKKWTGIEDMEFVASFGFDSHEFTMSATIATDWKLGPVAFQKASIFLNLPGTSGMGAFDLGIAAYIGVHVGHGDLPNNELEFDGKVMFGDDGLSLQAGLDTPWVHPFGIHGVTILDTEIELGFSYASFVPDLIGVSGGLQIGNVKGTATVFIAPASAQFVVDGFLSEFSLSAMLEDMTDDKMPKSIADTVGDVSFEDLTLDINLVAKPLVFNHQTFSPGIRFEIEHFDFWGMKGMCDVSIGSDGLYAKADIQPFDFANVLKVGGMTESGKDTGDMSLMIDLTKDIVKDGFEFSADAKFLDIIDVGMYMNISEAAGFELALQWIEAPLFNLFFNLSIASHGPNGQPDDFSLYADLGFPFLHKLESTVTGFLNGLKDAANKKIEEAQDKLNQWQAENGDKITQLEADVTKVKAEITAKTNEEEAELREHEASLKSYQATLNSYNNEIAGHERDKRHCHWYDVGCDAHNAWCDAQIAWDKTKIAFYKAKVDVEVDFLKAKGWFEKGISDIDKEIGPTVDLLHLKIAALSVLKVAEEGLEKGLQVAKEAIDGTLKLLVDAVGILFSLESIIATASSTNHLKSGGTASLSIKGEFLKKPYEWTISCALPPSFSNILKGFWATLKKDVHL